jgi:hypothetical protein
MRGIVTRNSLGLFHHCLATFPITRGRHFLVLDDGEGVPRETPAGRFRYVATHVCDSVMRRLKAEGTSGLPASSASPC